MPRPLGVVSVVVVVVRMANGFGMRRDIAEPGKFVTSVRSIVGAPCLYVNVT
jgi:hypothetical protein